MTWADHSMAAAQCQGCAGTGEIQRKRVESREGRGDNDQASSVDKNRLDNTGKKIKESME